MELCFEKSNLLVGPLANQKNLVVVDQVETGALRYAAKKSPITNDLAKGPCVLGWPAMLLGGFAGVGIEHPNGDVIAGKAGHLFGYLFPAFGAVADGFRDDAANDAFVVEAAWEGRLVGVKVHLLGAKTFCNLLP
jgi:hypothetical protein